MSGNGRESPASAGDTKELRLALVCYGGSSLAIYMHGVTKEIQRLVKASTMLEHAGAEWSPSPSEGVYSDLLRKLADEHSERLRTRVVVDVIAGTSAGGINGVFLAKALSHNRSQDSLRDLWFRRGDIDELLNAPRRLPRKLRLAWVALRALRRSPLRGDDMSRWLYDALAGMDEGGPSPETVSTLMPPRHLLELFVTVTDFYGYQRQIPIYKPRLVAEGRHRHVLAFAFEDGGRDDLSSGSNGELAFAARTTSCFPGVFPPVSLEGFARYLVGRSADLSRLAPHLFRLYELAGARPADAWFVDGGVLDNKPFGHAIAAIRQRPADLEVDRRLLYLEPAPGTPAKPTEHSAPNTVSALLGAVSGIPRAEPILDDILGVAVLNERVQRIQDIVETSFDRVGELVEQTIGQELTVPSDPGSPQLAEWAQALHGAALKEAGFSYATYIRLKISGVVDRYALAACDVCRFPPDSNQAMLLRAVLRCWAEEERLFAKLPAPTEQQTKFLRDFDLGYGERRMRFVVAGLSGWYPHVGQPGYPGRGDLDAGKARLYQAIETLSGAISGQTLEKELTRAIESCFAPERLTGYLDEHGLEAASFVAEQKRELDGFAIALRESLARRLSDFTPTLYRDLDTLTRDWDPARRRDLLVRYLGFPFWDVLLFPIQALSDVGERDRVEVTRMSPEDARLLSPLPGEEKVKGVALHHFGAFFSRADRENDYLWGRLDGAEQLVGLLLGSDTHPAYVDLCKKAFAAVLDEEERTLGSAQALAAHLRTQLRGPSP